MFLAALMGLIGTVIDRVIPDKVAAAKAKLELAKLELDADLKQSIGQLEINAKEGDHPSVFVAGWRPFIGWVCGIAFAYHFLVVPLILFIASISGHPVTLPEFSMEALLTVLLGMLGLGGLRTYEKYKGIANSFMRGDLKVIPKPEDTNGDGK